MQAKFPWPSRWILLLFNKPYFDISSLTVNLLVTVTPQQVLNDSASSIQMPRFLFLFKSVFQCAAQEFLLPGNKTNFELKGSFLSLETAAWLRIC